MIVCKKCMVKEKATKVISYKNIKISRCDECGSYGWNQVLTMKEVFEYLKCKSDRKKAINESVKEFQIRKKA